MRPGVSGFAMGLGATQWLGRGQWWGIPLFLLGLWMLLPMLQALWRDWRRHRRVQRFRKSEFRRMADEYNRKDG